MSADSSAARLPIREETSDSQSSIGRAKSCESLVRADSVSAGCCRVELISPGDSEFTAFFVSSTGAGRSSAIGSSSVRKRERDAGRAGTGDFGVAKLCQYSGGFFSRATLALADFDCAPAFVDDCADPVSRRARPGDSSAPVADASTASASPVRPTTLNRRANPQPIENRSVFGRMLHRIVRRFLSDCDVMWMVLPNRCR